MTWDILIASISHRASMLGLLLTELDRQMVPGVGIRVYQDNLEAPVGEKRQALIDSSDADYVSFVDDDDWIASNYVHAITRALEQEPDYVGFWVAVWVDGQPLTMASHSLQHKGWRDQPGFLRRDLSHLNPIRRDLATQARFDGGNGEDRRWADQLRTVGCVKSEVFVHPPMYQYRARTADSHKTRREPLHEHPVRPDFGSVTWVERCPA